MRWVYRITIWHGEGVSLFYVIRGDGHLDGTDWEIVAVFTQPEDAVHFVEEQPVYVAA